MRGPVLGFVLTMLAAAPGVSGQGPERRLELDQVSRVELPAGFIVTGGLLTDTSRAIVWGPSGLLRVEGGSDAQLLVPGDLLQIRGVQIARNDPATFRIMDAAGRLVDVRADGSMRPVAGLEAGGEVVQAVTLGDQWLVHVRIDAEMMPRVLLWRPTPEETTGGEVVAPPEEGWLPQLRLVSWDGKAFIQDIVDPYGVRRVAAPNPGPGVVTVLSGSSVRESLVAHGFPRANTVALPIVPLDEGYLYQLSDLESDRRLLITLDGGFRLIRSVVVPASMGFMAAAPEARELLALVDTGVPEVRFYRWRWSGDLRYSPTRKERFP